MTEEIKKSLIERNNRIIEIVKDIIEKKCPGTVDLIGIAGSFCNGDIYDKSDLDLVIIINNDKAKLLNVCFILGDVGFDIYTSTWDRLENMSDYNNPFVTKLFDLDIVYTRDETVLERYQSLSATLKENMSNAPRINKRVAEILGDVLSLKDDFIKTSDSKTKYKYLAKIISYTEYIIYMTNSSYVKRGVKRIPEEISQMPIVEKELLSIYLNLPTLVNIEESCLKMIDLLRDYLQSKDIEPIFTEKKIKSSAKKDITSEDLTGTYEEIVSNWYNKMVHAFKTGNKYLSFMTMASCQEFYDEMDDIYDIPEINLLGYYDPTDLEKNIAYFTDALEKWKKLYDKFDKKILTFKSLGDLQKYCQQSLN